MFLGGVTKRFVVLAECGRMSTFCSGVVTLKSVLTSLFLGVVTGRFVVLAEGGRMSTFCAGAGTGRFDAERLCSTYFSGAENVEPDPRSRVTNTLLYNHSCKTTTMR